MGRIHLFNELRYKIINLRSTYNKMLNFNMYYNDTINVIITADKCIYLYPSGKYFSKNAKNPSAQHVFKKGSKNF